MKIEELNIGDFVKFPAEDLVHYRTKDLPGFIMAQVDHLVPRQPRVSEYVKKSDADSERKTIFVKNCIYFPPEDASPQIIDKGVFIANLQAMEKANSDALAEYKFATASCTDEKFALPTTAGRRSSFNTLNF